MKTALLCCVTLFMISDKTFAQVFRDDCHKIARLDSLIHDKTLIKSLLTNKQTERYVDSVYKGPEQKIVVSPAPQEQRKPNKNYEVIDTSIRQQLPNQVKVVADNFSKLFNAVYFNENQLLISVFKIGQHQFDIDKFVTQLDCIKYPETANMLDLALELMIDSAGDRNTALHPFENANQTVSVLKQCLAAVRNRYTAILDREVSMYRFSESSKKVLKAIYVEHANDFFSIPKYNDDRDMTGAFRIELFTDLFKMRLFSPYSDRWWNLNGREWYAYQSVFVGGEGYTPFLRDTTIFVNDTSYDRNDRPYASTQYFGRAKYRMHKNGRIRIFSQFKLGSIGSSSPGSIQSALHRDLTIGSVRPNGWGAQIAAGGRISAQYEVSHEFLLLGENWFFTKGLTKWNTFKGKKWINVSIFDELKLGHDMTSVGVGLGLSNMGFKERGGIDMPFIERKPGAGLKNFFTKTFVFSYRFLYRYVVHNSMLEGYGIFKQTPDEDPTSPRDRWVLTGKQVRRHVQIHEVSLNFRLRFCGIKIKQTFMSPEYRLPVNNMIYPFAGGGQPGKHNTSPWNHTGTLGFYFKI